MLLAAFKGPSMPGLIPRAFRYISRNLGNTFKTRYHDKGLFSATGVLTEEQQNVVTDGVYEVGVGQGKFVYDHDTFVNRFICGLDQLPKSCAEVLSNRWGSLGGSNIVDYSTVTVLVTHFNPNTLLAKRFHTFWRPLCEAAVFFVDYHIGDSCTYKITNAAPGGQFSQNQLADEHVQEVEIVSGGALVVAQDDTVWRSMCESIPNTAPPGFLFSEGCIKVRLHSPGFFPPVVNVPEKDMTTAATDDAQSVPSIVLASK
ncbi:MAG: hypothetical protein K0U29_07325 [Gammaproteobacteria bacterium]|nr:hypothetical protein [Gammaproteobacteria bacterium]